MRIGVPKETQPGEHRVAVTPETAKKLIQSGHHVFIESSAGLRASHPDASYEAAGAKILTSFHRESMTEAGIDQILRVAAPSTDEVAVTPITDPGVVVVGMLNPFDKAGLQRLAERHVTGFALEAAPRTTRAQSMDVLSSQANIAGYKAVIRAADLYQKFVPMLMTAAGTVKAARVVILGVGVAGLQAIATAKRLGAVIEASDVRPSVKEQVESLGAKFIDVALETDEEREAAAGSGGYAKPMPPSWLARQKLAVAGRVAQADIVISTAQIPGRPAPTLVTPEMIHAMKPGSVLVDLAAGRGPDENGTLHGGNCPLTRAGQTYQTENGVWIVGETNLAAQLASDASSLYARNILDFLKLITHGGALKIPEDDDIVNACLMTHAGVVKKP